MKAVVISSFTKGENFYPKGMELDLDDDLVNRLVGERLVSTDLSVLDQEKSPKTAAVAEPQESSQKSDPTKETVGKLKKKGK